MSGGIQVSLAVFCFGAIFLSLENFELPYILLLLAAQLPVVTGCEGAAAAEFRPVRAVAPAVAAY